MKFGQNTALSPSSCVTLTGSIFLTKKSLKRKEIARLIRKLCVNMTSRKSAAVATLAKARLMTRGLRTRVTIGRQSRVRIRAQPPLHYLQS